jgi:2-polyprenyl-3-methyl-5-hydroxy-6-metoxy-1,4-benzoquinol methylase
MTHDDKNSRLNKMVEVNKVQSVYYDDVIDRSNFATRLVHTLRHRLIHRFRGEIGVKESLYRLHEEWMGDLSDKSVLDLGCGRGNYMSIPMAQRSKSYLAIDLSKEAIETMRNKLNKKGLPHARTEVLDFLSPDFTECFDVIYAHGVLHHFEFFDVFLERLAHHLNPHGIVISFDPLATSLTSRIWRMVYRPFQTDKEWEFPFTRKSFELIQNHFAITKVQGVFGVSKWALLVSMILPKAGVKLGKRLHKIDLERANSLNRALFQCLQVSMMLELK